MSHLPLNDDEYDELDELLAAMGGAAMDVSRLEGFLTALVVVPEAAAQERWLPKVWGGGDGDAAATGLVLRHYEYMRTWLRKDPGSFEPIFECGGSWGVDAWRDGFLQGMEIDAPAWAPLRATQPGLLAAFQHGADPAKVAPAVVQINAYFHAPQAKAAKIGRNDPCPCGSGKKSKKCCG